MKGGVRLQGWSKGGRMEGEVRIEESEYDDGKTD